MSDVIESRDGAILVLTLNRPERMNAVTFGLLDCLLDALNQAATDPDIGAILITGAGRGFCAGGDVKAMADAGPRSFEQRIEDRRIMHRVPLAIRQSPKVVVAAVNGPAMGAGLALAAACDFRIAARSAKFGAAFSRVGLTGDFGGSSTVSHLIGAARAREMYILNEAVDAARAFEIGLVTRVVEDAALMDEALAFTRAIAEGPRLSFSYIKRNFLAAETETFERMLEIEAIHQSRAADSLDHAEAKQAFAEKRAPVFRGL